MNRDEQRRLIEQIGIIRHPCDLDLLLFFVRHKRALLTSDHLATLLGYDSKRIADSLDALLSAGLLKRTQNPTHAARLYELTPLGPNGGRLSSLLQVASTRQGRLALIEVLPEPPPATENESFYRERIALVK